MMETDQELAERVRPDLERIVNASPAPVAIDAIEVRIADIESAGWRRHRRRLVGPAFVAVVGAVLVAGLAVAIGWEPGLGGPTLADATQPDVVEQATAERANEAAFQETVNWPHYLLATDRWELLSTEEIRPGAMEVGATTNQTFAVIQTGGDPNVGRIRLEVQSTTTESFSEDEGKFDLGGHPFSYAELGNDGAALTATWEWGFAIVDVLATGLDRAELEEQLLAMTARSGQPIQGFDAGEETELLGERLASESRTSPAVVWAWYGTETVGANGTNVEPMVQVQAIAAEPDDLANLAFVNFHGAGGAIETIDGREVLVAEDGRWTSAAWYGDDEELVSIQVRDLVAGDTAASSDGHQELADLIAAVSPVDQAGWSAAVASLSERIAAKPVIAEAKVGDVTLIAREGFIDVNGLAWSHLCITPLDSPETCRSNQGVRDGGPFLIAPFGTVPWPSVTVGHHTFNASIDGTWWVARFNEAEPAEEALQVASSDATILMAGEGAGRWSVASLPNGADGAEFLSPWGRDPLSRPSSE